MRKIVVLFAVLLFQCALLAQNNATRMSIGRLELVPNSTEASRAKKTDANGDKCALVKIQTPEMNEFERDRLEFSADRGTFVYPEKAIGEVHLFLTQGVKTLIIKHPDYGVLTYSVPINVEGNKTYTMILNVAANNNNNNNTGNTSIEINSNWVVVKVVPHDAIVNIDGKYCNNGKMMLSIDEPHELVVTHPLYHTYETTVYAKSSEKMTYNVAMTPAFGWLSIASKPESGATVLINGRRQGTTPFRSDTLASGEYEVTLLKDMYENVTKTVMVRDNNVAEVVIPMKATFAEMTLTTDADSDIYVDDSRVGKGTWKGRLGAGEHIAEARKASHRPTMKKIDVVAGKNESVKLDNPVPIYGALNINTTPDEATVYLDGTKIGETPLLRNNVLIGEHTLRFEKSNCATLEKTLTVSEGKILAVDEKLVPGREISIATDKDGDKIFIDGQYVGSSPLKVTLGFGQHEVKAERDGKTVSKTVTVSQSSTTSVKLAFSVGAGNGVFSVSATKKVHFATGNLQYQASTRTWRFAAHQWDYIGDANENISSSYSGWIDLFGWGTGNNPTKSSTSSSHYGSFTDWGNNTISNGGGKSWRTLTIDEWKYVFNTRSTSSGIRYAKAVVNGVNGVILLPDNWNSSNYSLRNTNAAAASYSSNSISQNDWTSSLEAQGAVFLPAAGGRYGASVSRVGSSGYYWSSTPNGTDNAYRVYFDSGLLFPQYSSDRYRGYSVRLVVEL